MEMERKQKRSRRNYFVTVVGEPAINFIGDVGEERYSKDDAYEKLRQLMEPKLRTGSLVRIEGDWPGPAGALSITPDGYYGKLHYDNGGGYYSRRTIINPIGRPKMEGSRIVEDAQPTNARFVLIRWFKC